MSGENGGKLFADDVSTRTATRPVGIATEGPPIGPADEARRKPIMFRRGTGDVE
jgi:hypothetical protein